MRTVSYRIDDLKKAVIHIGHVAENECTRVQIDAGDVYAEYPSAAVSLTVQPPAGEAFPAVVTRDGNMVIWDVKDSALTDNGMGEIQLTFTSGETVVKSCIGRISVSRSIVGEGEAPDPLEDFLAEAGAVLTAIPETIDTALAEAKASGEFDGPPGADGKDGKDGTDGKDGKDGYTPVKGVDYFDGADGQPGADGKDGADGFSPTATVTKSGKVATISITDKNGTTTETVSDGEDGDPTTLIDDTSTAGNKVWSASKTNELKSAINQSKAPVILDTASGEIVTIPDGADGMLVETLTVAIEPIQDLHGQASPYPAGGGKNLFDRSLMSDAESGAKYIDLSLKPNTEYTASSDDPMTSGAADIFFLLPGESVNTGTNGVYKNRPVTKTTGADGVAHIGYRVYNDLPVATLVGFETQVEESSTASSFAPYSNICPISGFTGANVERTGVNVWDEEWENGIWDGTGQKSAANDAIRCKNYIPVNPGTTYYLKFASRYTTGLIIRTLDKNKVFISTITKSQSDTFTTPERATYIVLCTYTADNITAYANDISINYPSTDHNYHPDHVASTSYPFPSEAGTVYGGTLTVNKDGTGKLVVDRASVDMGTMLPYKAPNNAFLFHVLTPTTGEIICSKYKTVETRIIFDNAPDKSIWTTNSIGDYYPVMLKDSAYYESTEADVKTALDGVQLVYELATPVVYNLTDLEVIALLKGNNNIWADTGETSIEYPADTKLYIDKKLAELQALILEN